MQKRRPGAYRVFAAQFLIPRFSSIVSVYSITQHLVQVSRYSYTLKRIKHFIPSVLIFDARKYNFKVSK